MTPESTPQRSGYEPELGGFLRNADERSGYEPELGGLLREKGVYVDETTCIGCKHCAHTAPNTFYIEEEHGRARAFRQDGDPEGLMQEAMDTCPVDCIYWLDYTELKQKEIARKNQVIRPLGLPQEGSGKLRATGEQRSKNKQ
ncbi:MAG: ferredoxin [Limnothrix sp.]